MIWVKLSNCWAWMKNFFKNFKSYGFWVSLSGALVILANAIGRAFGFSIENQLIEDLVMAFAGVLVVLGVVKNVSDLDENSKPDNKTEEDFLQEKLDEVLDEMFDTSDKNQEEKTEEKDEGGQNSDMNK